MSSSNPLSNFLDDTRIAHTVGTDTAYATVVHTRHGPILCTSWGTRCQTLEKFVAQHYAKRKTSVPPNTAWSACRFFKKASQRWYSCEEMLAPPRIPRQQQRVAKALVIPDDEESEFDFEASETESEDDTISDEDSDDSTVTADAASEYAVDPATFQDNHADGDDDTYRSESESDTDDETYVPESETDTESEGGPRLLIQEEPPCPWAPRKAAQPTREVPSLARPLEWGGEECGEECSEEVVAPLPLKPLPQSEPPTPLPSSSLTVVIHREDQEIAEEITIFHDKQRGCHQVVLNNGTSFGLPQDYFRLLLEYLRLDSAVTVDLHIPCFPVIRGIYLSSLTPSQVETIVRCGSMFFQMSRSM